MFKRCNSQVYIIKRIIVFTQYFVQASISMFFNPASCARHSIRHPAATSSWRNIFSNGELVLQEDYGSVLFFWYPTPFPCCLVSRAALVRRSKGHDMWPPCLLSKCSHCTEFVKTFGERLRTASSSKNESACCHHRSLRVTMISRSSTQPLSFNMCIV